MPNNSDPKKLAAGDEKEIQILHENTERRIQSNLKRKYGSVLGEDEIENIYSDVMFEETKTIVEGKYPAQQTGTPEGRISRKSVWRTKDYLRERSRKGPELAEGDTRLPVVSHDDPDVKRAARRRLSTTPADANEEWHAQPGKAVAKRLLDSLSDRDQTILESDAVDGLSAKEIGEMLDMTPNAVQQRLGRLKKRLRDDYNKALEEEGKYRRMKEGDFLKLLRDTLHSRESQPIDEEVQESMRETIEISQASLDRAHKKYVEKVFGYLHPQPVRRVTGRQTFGLWLEAKRKKGLQTSKSIARALGKEVSFVERLETGEDSPLSLNTSDAADIAILFVIHIDGVAQLVSNSEALQGGSVEIKVPIPSRITEFAKNRRESADDPLAWLGALYEELQRREATHLLL
jgi:RNA polymerase sigma factor (sigma-70 family)